MKLLRSVRGPATAVLMALAVVVGGPAVSSHADHVDISGHAGSDAYELVGELANAAAQAPQQPGVSPAASDAAARPNPYEEYRWLSVCVTPTTAGPLSETVCSAAQVCAGEDELMHRLWGRDSDGVWTPLAAQCFGDTPPAAGAPPARITEAMVLNEIRRIGLPTLEAKTQPAGKTLVNFDTIFYTEAQPFSATVTLLGRPVDIEARPSSYAWHHGDGEVTHTSTPGAPYPARDITYRYDRADTTVRPRVDVTYTARFRVAGGPWQDIDETVTITGPESSLRVAEAAAVLSGEYG